MEEILFLSFLHLGDDHTEIVGGHWEKSNSKPVKSDSIQPKPTTCFKNDLLNICPYNMVLFLSNFNFLSFQLL